MDGRALFPISLGNNEFSTDKVAPILPEIFAHHTSVVFLVADQLQLYNKALRIVERIPLGEIIKDFAARQHYTTERKRWIERLTGRLGDATLPDRWNVIGIEDIADGRCFRIFRNVMLAYYAIPEFRLDVDQAAREHARKHDDRYPIARREQLSRAYLLEEVALSLRVHVVEGIDSEYYNGQQSEPIARLYYGKYAFTAFELAEMPSNGRKIRLYSLAKQGLTRWAEYGGEQ